MTYTPGPWVIDDTGGFSITSKQGNGIAWIDGNYNRGEREKNEANARLIAAAPELLEALKAMLLNYENKFTDMEASAASARAAIAKAEGKS